MSDSDTSGFGKFVPGFDFLQNLAKGAGTGIAQMPGLGNWIAPTLNAEELDNRIEELKNVHFWLEQNSRALAATIQALEVQKMTLATLKGMNFNIGEVANAFKLQATDSLASGMQRAADSMTKAASAPSSPHPEPEPEEELEPEEDLPVPPAPPVQEPVKSAGKKASTSKAVAPMGVVDPLQLWGSLAQQFQNIAAGALKEVTAKSTVDVSRNAEHAPSKQAAKPGRAVRAVRAAGKKTAVKNAVSRTASAKGAATKQPASKRAAAKSAAAKRRPTQSGPVKKR